MDLKKLLFLLLVVCGFSACSGDGIVGENAVLFEEPYVEWGASKLAVKSYMSAIKGVLVLDDEEDDENVGTEPYNLFCTGVKMKGVLPYTITYEYAFNDEYYVEGADGILEERLYRGLYNSCVILMGTTEAQQEELNEEFLAFFKEKYVEVPLSSLSSDYWEEDFEDDGDESEILAAFTNSDRSVCIVVGVMTSLEGVGLNCMVAEYSCEF